MGRLIFLDMADKNIDISKALNPYSYMLKKTYDEDESLLSYEVEIVDVELDPINVIINQEFVELNTKGYNYINLDEENLCYLLAILQDYLEEIK